MPLNRLLRLALLGAMAGVLMVFINIQLPFMPLFLRYDPGDVPVVLGALMYGPVAGVILSALKIAVRVALKGMGNPVGLAANFLASATLAVTMAWIFWRAPGRGRALTAVALGTLAMAAIMIPANYYVFLPGRGVTGEAALTMAVSTLTPFNIVKGLISSILATILYFRLQPFLRRDLASAGGPASPAAGRRRDSGVEL